MKNENAIIINDSPEIEFLNDLEKEYYKPFDTYEYWDGNHFYSSAGDQLRDPEEYNQNSEGYTPFGDE